MAAGNFGSPMQLLILLAVVLLVFGGKRLRNLGGDLGSAIKGFKNSMASAEIEKPLSTDITPNQLSNTQPHLVSSNETEKSFSNRGN